MYIHILLATLFTLLPLHTCACTSPCATCSPTDPTYCLSCSGALSLVSLGLCNCPPGQYPLLALLTCLPCDSSCATCTGLVGTTCTGCASNKILYNGKCYAQCPDGKYFDTSTLTCKACDPSCQTCSAAGSTSCTSCNTGTGTVVNNGKCTCPSGQYKDSSTNTCKPCYSTCKECNGPLATDCTSCAVSGLMLQSNGECKCSAGTYLNTSPVSCLACDPSCQSCTGSAPNQCSSCKNNLVFSSGSCICGSGTYYDSSLVACMACDSTCGGCTGSASNQCTSCKNNLMLSSGSCTCPDGTFYDSSSLTCVNCDSSCKTCSGSAAYQCTSCEATYTLISGQCKCSSGCTCPSGTYFDSASLTCSPCHYSCAECSGPASNQCTSCDSDQYLSSSGTCLCASSSSCNCGSGTYFDSTALACSSCNPTCATCTGPNSGQCLSCANNLVFSSGQCTCPTKNYLHPTQHVCLQCHSSCASCTGPYANQCTTCSNNMVLLSNNICGCSSGNYADYGSLTCNVCDPNCKECSGPDSSQCTECFTPKVLENNYCLDACAAHQYRSYDGSCQECDSSCKECNGPTSIECTSCFPTSFLQMNQCIPTGCYQGCRTCQGVLINQCLTCMDGYAFYDNNNGLGTCTTQCPSYSYLTISNGILICRDKVEIDNAISYSGGFNQVKITFNRDIESDLETILDNIKISIVFRSEQPPISFSVSYSMTDDKQGIIIELSFNGHLLPGNILNVEYGQFITNSTINYYMTNDLQQVSLMEAYQYSDSAQQAINTTSAINTAASQANKVYSWASAFVLRSVHSMRSQIVEDMLECFIYMNVDFPPNFVQYASDNGDSLDNLVPNFGDFILDKMGANFRLLQQDDSGDSALGSKNAIDRYLQDKAFLINFGSELTLILIGILVLIIIEIFRCILKKYKRSKQSKVLAFFERACIYSSYALRWNFMLNQFISVYTQLALFSLIEVANIRELITPIDYLKYISGVIALFLAVVVLIGVFLLIRRVYLILNKKYKPNQKGNPEKETDFLERFSLFHKTFNSSKRGQLLYPFLLIVRSFGFALVIVFLQRVPWAQILYITLSTVILLALLIILKPFRSRTEQILTVVYELLFLTACTVTIALHVYNQHNLADIDGRSRLGFVICACSLLMVLLNLINCPLELWEVKKQLKAYKQKSKVSPASTMPAQALKAKVAQISPETSPINAKKSKSLVVQAQSPESTPKPKKPLLIPLNTIHEEENSKNENFSATLKKDKKAEAWKIHVRTVLDKKIDEVKLEEEPEDKPAKSNPTMASTLLAPKSTEAESKNLNQPDTEPHRRKRDFTLASLRALRSSSKLFSSTLEELDVLKPSSGDDEHLKPISPSFSRKRFLSRGTLLSPKDRQSPPVSKAESDPSSGSPDSQEVLPKSPKDFISSEEEDNKLESSRRLSPQLRLSELMLRKSMESRSSFDFDSSRVGLMKSPSISIDGSLLETYFERKHKLRMPRGQRETLTSIYIRNASATSSGLLSPQSNVKEA